MIFYDNLKKIQAQKQCQFSMYSRVTKQGKGKKKILAEFQGDLSKSLNLQQSNNTSDIKY